MSSHGRLGCQTLPWCGTGMLSVPAQSDTAEAVPPEGCEYSAARIRCQASGGIVASLFSKSTSSGATVAIASLTVAV